MIEYINTDITEKLVLFHDNGDTFKLILVAEGQHVASYLDYAVEVENFAEAQALFPDKIIEDTTLRIERPKGRKEQEVGE